MERQLLRKYVASMQVVIPSGPVAVPHFTFLSKASVSSWNRTITARQGLVNISMRQTLYN